MADERHIGKFCVGYNSVADCPICSKYCIIRLE